MYVCRKLFLKWKEAAILIQKIARGAIQRPKYIIMKKEAEAEARMNSKLAALQKRLNAAEMKYFQADKARVEAEKKAEDLVASGAIIGVGEDKPQAAEGEIMTAQQKALFDESGQMLEYLRSEVVKLRSRNYQVKKELTETKETYFEMSKHHNSLIASYEALKQHATQLTMTNMKQQVESNGTKDTLTKLKKERATMVFIQKAEVNKIKEDFRKREMDYSDEISRLRDELDLLKRKQTSSPTTSSRPQKRMRGKKVATESKPSSLSDYLNHQQALSFNRYNTIEPEEEVFISPNTEEKRRGRNFWARTEEKKVKSKQKLSSLKQKVNDKYNSKKSSLAAASDVKTTEMKEVKKTVKSTLSKASSTRGTKLSSLAKQSSAKTPQSRSSTKPKTQQSPSSSLQKMAKPASSLKKATGS